MTQGEGNLLGREFREGGRDAFERVVLEHQGVIFGFLRARVLQGSDAEDLSQEVFLRAFHVRRTFDPTSQLRPWLLGIARNLLRERARRLRRRKESAWTEICLESERAAEVEEGADEALLGHLPGCLDSLNPHARQAVDLHYTGKLRLQEIGSKLRRSEGAVKLLLFRARQALRDCLGSKCGKEDP